MLTWKYPALMWSAVFERSKDGSREMASAPAVAASRMDGSRARSCKLDVIISAFMLGLVAITAAGTG